MIGAAREAAEVVCINARHAETLRQSASNSSLPAVLDSLRVRCGIILWDEASGGGEPALAVS